MTNEELKKHLEEIRDRNDGLLTPKAVVAEASNPKHPLHKYFEWDDSVAAQKYREEQARDLFQRVKVEITTHTMEIRAPMYVRDPRLPPDEQGYRPVVNIRSEEDIAKKVLFDELDRVSTTLRRARAVAAVLNLSEELEALMDRVGVFRQKAEEATGESPTP